MALDGELSAPTRPLICTAPQPPTPLATTAPLIRFSVATDCSFAVVSLRHQSTKILYALTK